MSESVRTAQDVKGESEEKREEIQLLKVGQVADALGDGLQLVVV